ncbi:hypothetical protein FNJ87_13515, partial [Nonlabens mediterrranea]|nr:hypothetical protein [Nonlabens mediterrranea]
MNKEFLASTSVFAEMANNNVDLPKIINEFIINTYILNKTYSQNSAEIKNELIEHFDIDVPEAIVRTQLKKLTREEVVDYNDGQYIINPEHRQARQYISENVDEKKDAQNEIFDELSRYVKLRKGPLNDNEKEKLQSNFIF